jgi:hypothetical protein
MQNVLLLTATVRPLAGTPSLTRVDPGERLQDYARALSFYVEQVPSCFDAIVFAENSCADVSMLERVAERSPARGRVEFLSFDGLDYPPSHGRGYGEFKLVDHAMHHANALRSARWVWKCTGRYIVRNIERLVRQRPDVDLYCHARNYPYRLCDLFLLAFNRQGYETAIEGVYRHLRNDLVPGVHSNEEVTFRRLVDALPPTIAVQRRFTSTPLVDGVRGWNNARYGTAWAPKLMLRRAANVVAPWMWI